MFRPGFVGNATYMKKTRNTATVACAVLVGGRAVRRRKRPKETGPNLRGMCFQLATPAEIADGSERCVL